MHRTIISNSSFEQAFYSLSRDDTSHGRTLNPEPSIMNQPHDLCDSLTEIGCGQWPGSVTKLDAPVIPHMGWNTVEAAPGSRLFKGLDAGTRFYFVHSYAAQKWEGDTDALLTWATHHVRSPGGRRGRPAVGDAISSGEERRRRCGVAHELLRDCDRADFATRC